VISSGEPLTSFEKLFRPLDKLSWTFILIVSFGAFVILGLSKLFAKSFHKLLIESESTENHFDKTNLTRLLLMQFLIFFFIIRTLYAGMLFKFMQKSQFDNEIQTINEMIEKKFTFYAHDQLDLKLDNFGGR
jgi:hypothetical protein